MEREEGKEDERDGVEGGREGEREYIPVFPSPSCTSMGKPGAVCMSMGKMAAAKSLE